MNDTKQSPEGVLLTMNFSVDDWRIVAACLAMGYATGDKSHPEGRRMCERAKELAKTIASETGKYGPTAKELI